ncbi:hypothetical protein ACJX0J_022570, partial [Zea mays]
RTVKDLKGSSENGVTFTLKNKNIEIADYINKKILLLISHKMTIILKNRLSYYMCILHLHDVSFHFLRKRLIAQRMNIYCNNFLEQRLPIYNGLQTLMEEDGDGIWMTGTTEDARSKRLDEYESVDSMKTQGGKDVDVDPHAMDNNIDEMEMAVDVDPDAMDNNIDEMEASVDAMNNNILVEEDAAAVTQEVAEEDEEKDAMGLSLGGHELENWGWQGG